MNPMPYTEMSDLALLQLCMWREARGEVYDGKRGVAHVVKNRSLVDSWWNGHIVGSLSRVILQPYQFSSFSSGDPNANKWPSDDDPSFADCCSIALGVMSGSDADNTNGATYYFDISIGWPVAWGNKADFTETLDVGRLRFFKPKLQSISMDAGDF
jgi:spore germination cell wall hydrolase CwlJ-like protein